MSTRQGSASYTIVIGGIAALIVGAVMLTLVFYPVVTALLDAAFWSAETTHGVRVNTYTRGFFVFWGGINLIALLAWIWIRTRQ